VKTWKYMDFCGGSQTTCHPEQRRSRCEGPNVGRTASTLSIRIPKLSSVELDPAHCSVGANCRTVPHPAWRPVQDDKLVRLLSEHYSFVAVDQNAIFHVRSYRP
jgi:hypothetical protein